MEHSKRESMLAPLVANGLREGDIVMTTDADEIPSSDAINLMRWCDGLPNVLNLVGSFSNHCSACGPKTDHYAFSSSFSSSSS